MILWGYVIFLVICLGITLYGFYNLIIYLTGKKVKAIISKVDTKEHYDASGPYAIIYTYSFIINNETKIIKGPKNYLLFPTIFSSERKFGKRVYISYNEKTNKVSMQLHTIIWWTALGILGLCGFSMEIKSLIESIIKM